MTDYKPGPVHASQLLKSVHQMTLALHLKIVQNQSWNLQDQRMVAVSLFRLQAVIQELCKDRDVWVTLPTPQDAQGPLDPPAN